MASREGDQGLTLYPPPQNVTVVPPKPPTKSELRAVELQQLIKKGIRESPYYFNIDDNIKADAKGKRKPAAAVYDPFEDAPTFGNKHGKVQKKGLPSLKSMQAEMQKGGFSMCFCLVYMDSRWKKQIN